MLAWLLGLLAAGVVLAPINPYLTVLPEPWYSQALEPVTEWSAVALPLLYLLIRRTLGRPVSPGVMLLLLGLHLDSIGSARGMSEDDAAVMAALVGGSGVALILRGWSRRTRRPLG